MKKADNKDWIGNEVSTFKCLGASNHTDKERETRDFYATDPIAAEWLLKMEYIPKEKPIWEPACGIGHLSHVFEETGYTVRSSDIIVRCEGVEEYDFLQPPLLSTIQPFDGTIITNPPYKYVNEFILRALETVTEGNKVCMFLKVQFLEGKARRKIFEKYPPLHVWVSSSRINCAMNGNFELYTHSPAVAYAWFVWQKGYIGDTILKFFN